MSKRLDLYSPIKENVMSHQNILETFMAESEYKDKIPAAFNDWCLIASSYIHHYVGLGIVKPNDPNLKAFEELIMSDSTNPQTYPKIMSPYSKLLKQIENFENAPEASLEKNDSPKEGPEIFIVHGHDEQALNDVKKYIKGQGFKPIVLREQINKGRTLIQKLEDIAANAEFAIILYTPCDKGRKKHAQKLKPRARQNVVFEHGYFYAKLGRERVLPLYKEGVELPGDISGVVYTPMDESGKWKLKLAQELTTIKRPQH